MMQNNWNSGKHVVAPHDAYFDVAMATVLLPVSFCCKSNTANLTV